MAVIVETEKPSELLQSLKQAMKERTVETWSVDSDGDFTHSPEQWANKAWFRPKIEQDRLVFRMITPKGKRMSRTVYAVYHGRFIEMLLAHFDLKFTRAYSSALPSEGDVIGSESNPTV